jgi:hypothetical protein
MRNLGAGIVCLLCLAAVAGCTTNKSIANVNFTTQATLELSVGTINDNSGTLGIGGVTLNAVTSFRNQFGNSAYITPGFFSLTGPAGTIISSDPTNSCDQLFSYGELPGCQTDSLTSPLWGMPPGYNPPNSLGGYSLGFIKTGSPLTSGGSYTVSTVVPVNGSTITYTVSATLPSAIPVLPNATGVTTFVSDGKGGGTFTIGNPKRVRPHGGVVTSPTEFLIIVTNTAGSATSTVATVETTGTSATIIGTGDCIAAQGIPIPCGANNAYVIDADYPLVEAGPPASTLSNPTLAGAKGTSDISASPISTINE